MFPLHLHGASTSLREIRPADVNDAWAIVGDDQVTETLSFDSKSLEQTRSMVEGIIERAQAEPRSEYYLAVTRTDDPRMIGFIRLGLSGIRAGKLGYALAADAWGHGYATDAARTLITWGFETLDLHRITAAVGPENQQSTAVLDRLGFRYEGRLRDHVYTGGAWRDSLLYSILAPEWTAST